MKTHISFVFSIVCCLVFINCNQGNESVLTVISPEEMQNLLKLDDVQLIDVRTSDEYNVGFISRAQNIDYFSSTFANDILSLDKNKPVLVYCKSGGRSGKCAKKLVEAGFVKIYDLEGGISKWKHQGLEVKTKL